MEVCDESAGCVTLLLSCFHQLITLNFNNINQDSWTGLVCISLNSNCFVVFYSSMSNYSNYCRNTLIPKKKLSFSFKRCYKHLEVFVRNFYDTKNAMVCYHGNQKSWPDFERVPRTKRLSFYLLSTQDFMKIRHIFQQLHGCHWHWKITPENVPSFQHVYTVLINTNLVKVTHSKLSKTSFKMTFLSKNKYYLNKSLWFMKILICLLMLALRVSMPLLAAGFFRVLPSPDTLSSSFLQNDSAEADARNYFDMINSSHT